MATVKELKAQAKARGIKGFSTMKKAELEAALEKPPPKPPRLKTKAQQAMNPVKQVQPPKKKAEAPKKVTNESSNGKGIDFYVKELEDLSKDKALTLGRKYLSRRVSDKKTAESRELMEKFIAAVRYFGGAKKVQEDVFNFVPAERTQRRVDTFTELLKKKTLPSKKEKPSSLTKYIKENQSLFEKYQKEEEKKITEKIPKMILDGYTKGQLAKVAKAAKDKAKARMEKEYLTL